ncbi:hypothetical protein Rhow_002343 [Rhodococcus wratislaviensis]|uniref:Uncharacterized protein n=1 Tax=Rhodococcus wratislaviensis TaxID=44752 RepID=A0A402C5E7_RHOWR|nr:hypothetical protein Rhow_002343 [Rhodococcus wratislaviensis]
MPSGGCRIEPRRAAGGFVLGATRAQDGIGTETAGARAPDPVDGKPLGSVWAVLMSVALLRAVDPDRDPVDDSIPGSSAAGLHNITSRPTLTSSIT